MGSKLLTTSCAPISSCHSQGGQSFLSDLNLRAHWPLMMQVRQCHVRHTVRFSPQPFAAWCALSRLMHEPPQMHLAPGDAQHLRARSWRAIRSLAGCVYDADLMQLRSSPPSPF